MSITSIVQNAQPLHVCTFSFHDKQYIQERLKTAEREKVVLREKEIPIGNRMEDFFKAGQVIIRVYDENDDINDKPPHILIRGKKASIDKVESLLDNLLNIPSKSDGKDITPLSVPSSVDLTNKPTSLIDRVNALGDAIGVVLDSSHSLDSKVSSLEAELFGHVSQGTFNERIRLLEKAIG